VTPADASRAFPETRISLIESLRAPSEAERRRAADLLARAYWGPVKATLMARWNLENADAEDLTQEFFAEAFVKEWLQRFDPAKARFRTFIRMCADRVASRAHEAGNRVKRGGGAAALSLDEAVTVADDDGAGERFHREWVRSVFSMALGALATEADAAGKDVHVEILRAYDVDDPPDDQRPTYKQLAERFGIPETQVTNYLAWARRALRRHVLGVLRALAATDAEYREDVQELLGIRAP